MNKLTRIMDQQISGEGDIFLEKKSERGTEVEEEREREEEGKEQS
jgi:hypothetical protein